jgi:hypothetical protein
MHIYDPAVRYIYDQLLVDQQRRGTTMTIEWEESEDDWQERYGISDELAEEMGEYQELGFHALEYGPASDAVRAFLWLVEQWARIAGIRDDNTMTQRAFLARAFFRDGQTLLAADELRQLVADRTEVFGADDPQVLRTRGQLGQVLARGGYPLEGIEIQEVLLEDRERLYGPDAPAVFDTMGNLAESYLLANHHVRGRDLYADLLERRTRILGEEHEDTVRTYLNYSAACAQASTDTRDAIAILEAAVVHLDATVGSLDQSTLTCRGHLADFHIHNGDLTVAAEMLTSLLTDRMLLLGPDHPDTIRSSTMLADVESKLRDDDQNR